MKVKGPVGSCCGGCVSGGKADAAGEELRSSPQRTQEGCVKFFSKKRASTPNSNSSHSDAPCFSSKEAEGEMQFQKVSTKELPVSAKSAPPVAEPTNRQTDRQERGRKAKECVSAAPESLWPREGTLLRGRADFLLGSGNGDAVVVESSPVALGRPSGKWHLWVAWGWRSLWGLQSAGRT